MNINYSSALKTIKILEVADTWGMKNGWWIALGYLYWTTFESTLKYGAPQPWNVFQNIVEFTDTSIQSPVYGNLLSCHALCYWAIYNPVIHMYGGQFCKRNTFREPFLISYRVTELFSITEAYLRIAKKINAISQAFGPSSRQSSKPSFVW